ncbi:MAG TPA: extracellular solute-binding protein [Candidatus Sulfotelmatobacter sp.]|nr:extracellular solute-binding protein [Candidatus Sulfotelmatobacter sp.]
MANASARNLMLPGLVLLGVLSGALLGAGARAAAPAPTPVTPALIEAATKEGKVVWYTSVELRAAEQIAKAFETKYPGITVQVERSGAERNFQRLAQEYGSGIHVADVLESSDAAQFIVWKRQGWLAPFVAEDVAKYWPADQKDPDGDYATWRSTFAPMGYNTKLVKAEDAPKSYADLLDPKWSGKIVKAHPGYSGTIMTATFEIARDIGWTFFEKLAKQHIMQVQSAIDPPKKLAAGERAVMADSSEAMVNTLVEAGNPIAPIYATEGTPFITGPCGIVKEAPHPNAARLFVSFMLSVEGQQLVVDVAGMRSLHPQVKEKPGRTPLSAIKAMKDDPAAVESQVETIKRKYTQYFHT